MKAQTMKAQTDIEMRFIELCKNQDKRVPSQHGYGISEIVTIAWVLGVDTYFKNILMKRQPYKRGELRNDNYLAALKSIGTLRRRKRR